MKRACWLVSLKDVVSAADREDIDREAERIVARAYRAACRDTGRVERAFDLAVEAYRNHYPHVPNASSAPPSHTFLRAFGRSPGYRGGHELVPFNRLTSGDNRGRISACRP
jgi:hypothetical protein